MFPPSNTVGRWVHDGHGGPDIFALWEENFSDAIGHERGLKAVEVFVELGGGGGAALYIFDGKNYWSPVYDQSAVEYQFESQTGHAAGVHSSWDDFEFDPYAWALEILDNYEAFDYENVGTRVPTVF
jgi:hypothetical protein